MLICRSQDCVFDRILIGLILLFVSIVVLIISKYVCCIVCLCVSLYSVIVCHLYDCQYVCSQCRCYCMLLNRRSLCPIVGSRFRIDGLYSLSPALAPPPRQPRMASKGHPCGLYRVEGDLSTGTYIHREVRRIV